MRALKFVGRALLVIIISIGIISAIGGAAIGAIAMWRLDLIQAVLPKDVPIMPVNLSLYGPRFGVQGDRVYFHAVVNGRAGKVVWSVNPPKAGIINVLPNDDNGSTIEFSSLEEGKFLITAVVAGEGNQAAHDQIEFQNLVVAQEEEQPPTGTLHPAESITAQSEQPPPQPPATATEMTLGAFANVMSENKIVEARHVAGTIIGVAKRIQAGNMPFTADIPLEIEQQSKIALQDSSPSWGSFMVAIDTIIEEYRRQGKVTTVATQVPVLMEIANTLYSIR